MEGRRDGGLQRRVAGEDLKMEGRRVGGTCSFILRRRNMEGPEEKEWEGTRDGKRGRRGRSEGQRRMLMRLISNECPI